MKNEVGERREGRVLFEPPEPLFPELMIRRPRLLPRLAAFLLLVGLAAVIWMIAVSAKEGEEESDSTREMSSEVYQSDSLEGVFNTEADEKTESEAEETVSYTEEVSKGNEEVSEDNESESESEAEGVTDVGQLMPEVIESDLSELERGNEYIINYTDKAPDVAGLIDRGFCDLEEKNHSAPLVMVIHTHTKESYLGASNSFLGGVAAVGDRLCQSLNKLGLSALHCTVIHDGDENNAYLNSGKTIQTMLEIYPSIKYVIDLHRLELMPNGLPLKTVSGSADGSAQIRLTVSTEGYNWQESLSLALSLRQRLNQNGERICMPPTVSPSRYNSDLSRYYIMADIGAVGNTVSEAKAAAERLAKALADTVLKK